MVVSPGDRFTGEFIESYLLTPLIQRNYFGNIKARAGQPHLNSDQLLNTPMLVPPKPLQEKFSRFVVTLRNQQVKRSESLKNLNNLFAAMLHRAFTGELTAKWREAHLKELLVEMEHQAKLLRTAAETN
jgi:type I restriction enzyme S subunit